MFAHSRVILVKKAEQGSRSVHPPRAGPHMSRRGTITFRYSKGGVRDDDGHHCLLRGWNYNEGSAADRRLVPLVMEHVSMTMAVWLCDSDNNGRRLSDYGSFYQATWLIIDQLQGFGPFPLSNRVTGEPCGEEDAWRAKSRTLTNGRSARSEDKVLFIGCGRRRAAACLP